MTKAKESPKSHGKPYAQRVERAKNDREWHVWGYGPYPQTAKPIKGAWWERRYIKERWGDGEVFWVTWFRYVKPDVLLTDTTPVA